MPNGHDERTRAILEHLARRSVQTETRVEAIPGDIQTLLLEMADTIASLNRRVTEIQNTVDAMGTITGADMLRRQA